MIGKNVTFRYHVIYGGSGGAKMIVDALNSSGTSIQNSSLEVNSSTIERQVTIPANTTKLSITATSSSGYAEVYEVRPTNPTTRSLNTASPKSITRSAAPIVPQTIEPEEEDTEDEKEIYIPKINVETIKEEKEITIDYEDEYINEYSLDLGKTWITYTDSFKVDENITIIARSKDSEGNVVSSSSYTITTIEEEEEEPTIDEQEENKKDDEKEDETNPTKDETDTNEVPEQTRELVPETIIEDKQGETQESEEEIEPQEDTPKEEDTSDDEESKEEPKEPEEKEEPDDKEEIQEDKKEEESNR